MDLDQLVYEPTTPALKDGLKTAPHCPYEVLLDHDEFGDFDDEEGIEFNVMDFFEDEYD